MFRYAESISFYIHLQTFICCYDNGNYKNIIAAYTYWHFHFFIQNCKFASHVKSDRTEKNGFADKNIKF